MPPLARRCLLADTGSRRQGRGVATLGHMAYVQHSLNLTVHADPISIVWGFLLAGTRRPGKASRWAADPHAEALVGPGEIARQILSGAGGKALFQPL